MRCLKSPDKKFTRRPMKGSTLQNEDDIVLHQDEIEQVIAIKLATQPQIAGGVCTFPSDVFTFHSTPDWESSPLGVGVYSLTPGKGGNWVVTVSSGLPYNNASYNNGVVQLVALADNSAVDGNWTFTAVQIPDEV